MTKFIAGSLYPLYWFRLGADTETKCLINSLLIFARAHWMEHMTWYKIGQQVSGNVIFQFDIRRPILLTREKQERKSLFQVFNFLNLFTLQ